MNVSDRAEGWIRFGDWTTGAGGGEEGVVDACVSILCGDFKPSDSFPGGNPVVLEASGGAWAAERPELRTSSHYPPLLRS